MDRNDELRLFNLYLANMDMAVEMIDSTIIPTIKDFDGKVINRRLENTLKEKLNNIEMYTTCKVDIQTSLLNIYIVFWGRRCIQTTNECTAYLSSGMEQILCCHKYIYYPSEYIHTEETDAERKSFRVRNPEHHIWIDGDNLRLNADFVIASLKAGKENLIKESALLKEKVKQVDEFQTRFKEIQAQIEELNNDIPSEFRYFFDGFRTYPTWG